MGRMKVEYLEMMMERQKDYDLSDSCKPIIIADKPVVRSVIVSNDKVLATIPDGTLMHEIETAAYVLQGISKRVKYEVTWVLANHIVAIGSEFNITGELTTVLGLVIDKKIVKLFPDTIAVRKRLAYETVQNTAAILGGRLEEIVVRAYYKPLE